MSSIVSLCDLLIVLLHDNDVSSIYKTTQGSFSLLEISLSRFNPHHRLVIVHGFRFEPYITMVNIF